MDYASFITNPRDFQRTPEKDKRLAAYNRKKYPLAAAGLEKHAEKL